MNLMASNTFPPKTLDKAEYETKRDSLVSIYGEAITAPEKYELALMTACTFIPEMRFLNIEFKLTDAKTFLSVRPTNNSFFKKKKNRVYRISLNEQPESMGGLRFDEVPFAGQVGILVHELEHIRYYHVRNGFKIIANGIGYGLSPKFHTQFEQETDYRTIKRGAGYLLHTYQDFILNQANTPEKLRAYKDKYYLMPDEMMELIQTTFSYLYK